jgi:hypothetical protein
LIAAALAALAFVAACGSGSGPAPEGTTKPGAGPTASPAGATASPTGTPIPLLGSVKSADGAARVDVPVGSLPAGLRVEDIKIAAIDPESLPVTFPDGPVLAAYRLEPDGAKFPQPVTFTVTVPSKEAFLPSVAMLSGGEVSAALDVQVVFDAASESLTVITKTDHFSEYVVAQKAFFRVAAFNQPDRFVNQDFTQEVEVALVQRAYRTVAKPRVFDDLLGLDETELIKLDGGPQLTGRFEALAPVLSPQIRLGVPSSETFDGTKNYLATFRCNAPGQAAISYTASLTVPTFWQRRGQFPGAFQGREIAEYSITVRGEQFRCLAGEAPTVTPTVPVSARENRPPLVSPIQAVLGSGSLTRYTVIVSDPDGDILTVVWDGRDCGPQAGRAFNDTLEGQGESEMGWQHTATDCHRDTFRTPEPHPVHANKVIRVTVSDANSLTDAHFSRYHWQVVCTYTGVASGTGPACAAPVKIAK